MWPIWNHWIGTYAPRVKEVKKYCWDTIGIPLGNGSEKLIFWNCSEKLTSNMSEEKNRLKETLLFPFGIFLSIFFFTGRAVQKLQEVVENFTWLNLCIPVSLVSIDPFLLRPKERNLFMGFSCSRSRPTNSHRQKNIALATQILPKLAQSGQIKIFQ